MNGVDVRKLKQQSLRGRIGVVPQDTPLFNESLLYNIRYGKQDATMEECREAAEQAQILGFIESQEKGWETLVGERGLKLSGGEKQRVAIARCLLKNPPIVLLDEATSSLDANTEQKLQGALDGLGTKRTVIVIAHRLGTIRNAHQILVLGDEGNIVERGTHDELLGIENGVYRRLWETQLHSAEGAGAGAAAAAAGKKV